MNNITAIIPGSNTKFELRNVREVYGHDDSLPFNADVYVNDKHVANAYNSGWGGDTEYNILPNAPKNVFADVETTLGKIEFLRGFDSFWSVTKLIGMLASASLQDHRKSYKVKPM